MSTNTIDKARQQLMSKVEQMNKGIDEALRCFKTTQDQAESIRERKALQAKIDTAARTSGPAATKALVTLLKQGEQLSQAILQRSYDQFTRELAALAAAAAKAGKERAAAPAH